MTVIEELGFGKYNHILITINNLKVKELRDC